MSISAFVLSRGSELLAEKLFLRRFWRLNEIHIQTVEIDGNSQKKSLKKWSLRSGTFRGMRMAFERKTQPTRDGRTPSIKSTTTTICTSHPRAEFDSPMKWPLAWIFSTITQKLPLEIWSRPMCYWIRAHSSRILWTERRYRPPTFRSFESVISVRACVSAPVASGNVSAHPDIWRPRPTIQVLVGKNVVIDGFLGGKNRWMG